MTIDLYLFRHGETENNIANPKVFAGRTDCSLTKRGKLQSLALGMRLRREGIKLDEIYSSIMKRAVETAEEVCIAQDVPIDQIGLVDELIEINPGDWGGRVRKDVFTPEVVRAVYEDPLNYRPLNGESLGDVEKRVYGWFNRELFVPEKEGLKIGVFTHSMSLRCFLRGILDSKPELIFGMNVDNCSITHLKYCPQKPYTWEVVKINDNSHLEEVGYAHDS